MVTKQGRQSLARVSALDGRHSGSESNAIVMMDDYVVQAEPVVDHLTRFSGIRPGRHLNTHAWVFFFVCARLGLVHPLALTCLFFLAAFWRFGILAPSESAVYIYNNLNYSIYAGLQIRVVGSRLTPPVAEKNTDTGIVNSIGLPVTENSNRGLGPGYF